MVDEVNAKGPPLLVDPSRNRSFQPVQREGCRSFHVFVFDNIYE